MQGPGGVAPRVLTCRQGDSADASTIACHHACLHPAIVARSSVHFTWAFFTSAKS